MHTADHNATATGHPAARVALYGGTFDPPHRGHLAAACAAATRFNMQRMLLAPVGVQALKQTPPVATYQQRLHMVSLLCEEAARQRDSTQFEPSTLDAPRADGLPNYTIDAVRRLRRDPACAEIFIVVGADSFLDLRRWKEPDALLDTAQWIVVSRPGFAMEHLKDMALSAQQQAHVHLLDGIAEPARATELRARLARGEPCDDWLTPAVSQYIRDHGIYRNHASIH